MFLQESPPDNGMLEAHCLGCGKTYHAMLCYVLKSTDGFYFGICEECEHHLTRLYEKRRGGDLTVISIGNVRFRCKCGSHIFRKRVDILANECNRCGSVYTEDGKDVSPV